MNPDLKGKTPTPLQRFLNRAGIIIALLTPFLITAARAYERQLRNDPHPPLYSNDMPGYLLLAVLTGLFTAILLAFSSGIIALWDKLKKSSGVHRQIRTIWSAWLLLSTLLYLSVALTALLWRAVYPLPDYKTVTMKNFNFRNYVSYEASGPLQDALNNLLPVGTPRAEVDRFLVTQEGSTPLVKRDAGYESAVIYFHEEFAFLRCGLKRKDIDISEPAWQIAVEYDTQQKLLSLTVKNGLYCGL